jgi:hypothetical protein
MLRQLSMTSRVLRCSPSFRPGTGHGRRPQPGRVSCRGADRPNPLHVRREKPAATAQALSAASAITYNYSRATALAKLASHLRADERSDVMAQGLAAATAITNARRGLLS